MLRIFEKASVHKDRTAIVSNWQNYRFGELVQASDDWARKLLGGSNDLHEERVAFMVSPGFDYVKYNGLSGKPVLLRFLFV